jgi:hypothetical protein
MCAERLGVRQPSALWGEATRRRFESANMSAQSKISELTHAGCHAKKLAALFHCPTAPLA